jgi:hypothetical protein
MDETSLEILERTGAIIAKSAMFSVLLVLARGWLLIRSELSHAEMRLLAASSLTLVVLFAAYHLLASLPFFALAVMYMTGR